ncbi:E3 ubiquitin ligase RNF157 [Planococcus citri]|uniref:E3 ubiquitin ligase RNF157 n=1 Tax=Planococcus citri TaxID=170843 RepID=UPI0031F7B5F0
MGAFTSRQNARNEETDLLSNQAYRYPTKSGNYFSNYFIMGGEKFDAPQPEAYLFGDNMDLNFLGNKPIPFPYPPPQTGDPTLPLKCLVNVRRESVRFVRVNDPQKNTSYNVEFTFDTDVRCSITICYFCTEEITLNGIKYVCKDEKLTSDVYYYKRGANQQFSQSGHCFDPSSHSDQDLFYNCDKDVIPVAIHCIALEGLEEGRQSHTTYAIIERHADDSFSLKALKQKLFVDGLCYLLQEIYGIENKINDVAKEGTEEEIEDAGLECVICMSDMRDTLILPCRHLCLCQACADSLRYQANNCPICRSPFRALLQIKAMHKLSESLASITEMNDGIPPGYERVSLIEALNGPVFTRKYATLESSTLEPLLDSSSTASVIHPASVTTVAAAAAVTATGRNK